MKRKDFKTSKGEFAIVDLPLDVVFVSQEGLVRFEDDVSYTPIFHYEVESIARLKEITEEQASEIVDEWFTSDDGVIFYTDYTNKGRAFTTPLASLNSLIKSLGIHLYENPIDKNLDYSDKLCDYCHLDNKGVYNNNGGSVAGCEGSSCEEAKDNHHDHYLEQSLLTFYNPYIFKVK